MKKAQAAFGIKVEDPLWVEVERTEQSFKNNITSALKKEQIQIAVVIIKNPKFKKSLKSLLDSKGIPSQFILSSKLFNVKLGVVSNILKQMNTKIGKDLYRLNLPKLKNSLLIGVDLINEGDSRLIGCSATYSQTMTQCFSQVIRQHPTRLSAEEKKTCKETSQL